MFAVDSAWRGQPLVVVNVAEVLPTRWTSSGTATWSEQSFKTALQAGETRSLVAMNVKRSASAARIRSTRSSSSSQNPIRAYSSSAGPLVPEAADVRARRQTDPRASSFLVWLASD